MNGWKLQASELERAAGEAAMAACQHWPEGPGLVIGSGGSTGGRKWCLQSWQNLEQSAASTGRWLTAIGIDPSRVRLVNPLSPDHIGGLMPQVRSQHWEAPLLAISPRELKCPEGLLQRSAELTADGREALISLVPTQLQRLLDSPAGIQWLQLFRLIWVGGAALSPALAQQAREAQLQLSPCYGATETAAMVCALDPAAFLEGGASCGHPLDDVELRLDPKTSAISVNTRRLSPGWLAGAELKPFADADRWWRSGDAGQLNTEGLQVKGRLDGALNSGGATVFPEQIEASLIDVAGVEALLVVGIPDAQWGQQLVGLMRLNPDADPEAVLQELQERARGLTPAERPRQWQITPELSTNHQGKWERRRWAQSAQRQQSDTPGTVQPS